jgi:RNA methyltransferase, TrmH family
MLALSKIKFIRSLQIKKYRDEEGLFIAEGDKIVREALISGYDITLVVAEKDWLKNNKNELSHFAGEIIETDSEGLKRISSLKTPNNVLSVIRKPDYKPDTFVLKEQLSLVLDTIQDPGNLGTIIRIADWFGIKDIICSPSTADVYNPKVVQSTMGAIFRVNTYYSGLTDFLKKSADIPVYGTLLEGENIFNSPLTSHGLIILGNESKGISEELLPFINHRLFIPSFPPGAVSSESLNVSSAAAIVCAEFRRRTSST